jgi:hypothetical protein
MSADLISSDSQLSAEAISWFAVAFDGRLGVKDIGVMLTLAGRARI